MRIALTGFAGAIKALHPKLLPESVGVNSLNQKPGRGDFRPWKLPLQVATVPHSRRTIYRMGRDTVSNSSYWLSWPTSVHVMRGFNAEDTTEKTYYTGNGPPKWTDNTKALAGEPYPTAWRLLGIPAPTDAPVLDETTAGTGTDETRYYVTTFVTDEGEESAPSPPSLPIVCKPGAVISIEELEAAPFGSYGINRRRIYRTQTGNETTEFFFLREVAIGVTTTTDDARGLGEVLPTVGWLTPPSGGHHLISLWNGIASMLSGKSIRYCEPYTLYAWPLEYELVTADTAVAQAAYQQTQVVLTTGKPYVIEGQDPASMSEVQLELDQACVSERSVVSMGHGVCWASPDGLCYIGAGGSRILTEGLMLREDWQALKPTTIVGGRFESLYVGFYSTDGGVTMKGFMLDPANTTGLYFLSEGYVAAFRDTVTDHLFVLEDVLANFIGNIKQWDGGATLMTATFRSKIFRTDAPANLGAALVVADNFPVTVKVWADKIQDDGSTDWVLVITKTVTNNLPWRLPAGFLAEFWQIEVSCAGAVQGVVLATSMDELA